MILTTATTIAGLLILVLVWAHGLRFGLDRGVTYASDRHAGYTEGLAAGRRESQLERDELIARLVQARAEPPTVWSDAVPPGGYVCAVPSPDLPSGICGWPVESEPCPEHGVRDLDDAGRWP